jgi:hypothetical protein
MLWVELTDRDYIKVAEVVPRSADELMLYGYASFKR